MSVLVWAEQTNGQIASSALEVLGKAGSLATELGLPLHVLVMGENVGSVAQEAARYGATEVLAIDSPALAEYRMGVYTEALKTAIAATAAKVVLTPATAQGRDVCAAAAFDLDGGLAPDVVDLRVEDGQLIAVRAVYSNNILGDVVFTGEQAFISVRPRAFVPAQPTADPSPIQELPFDPPADLVTERVVAGQAAGSEEVNLSDARVIVSGGRGVAEDPEKGFALVGELATVLDAAVGASRAAVDAGYVPYKHQVGQTGKTVRPDLYIAAGISGAIQHLAGMSGSKIIVAINRDGSAPIFERAHYGIVGDLYELLPALTQAFRQRLGE